MKKSNRLKKESPPKTYMPSQTKLPIKKVALFRRALKRHR